MSRDFITIGQFAELTHLTPRALRLYEREGLLEPALINETTGYRYYRHEQTVRAEYIRLLRTLDLPLSEIKRFLEQKNKRVQRKMLAAYGMQVRKRMRQCEESLARLHALLE